MARINGLRAEARRVIAAYDGKDLEATVAKLAAIGYALEDALSTIP